ncbi:MAG TPA: 2-oxoacid:acceptor oxidoreductase family protein, partial [Acidobacteriota bacterium]|nr:2-oxoacid:acceptor oxidoreductase family protein [Acidobacteriota bacterium]
MDFALIAQAATLEARVPFLHFFDGFRTSHEVSKIEKLNENDIRAMIDQKFVAAQRSRALSPDHPFIRGTAQNPDVYFQARESVNPFYLACPTVVQNVMDRFAALTGRQYHLFDYAGAPDAERVLILMGSGCETVEEFVRAKQDTEKIGLLKVRLFRPFSVNTFLSSLPSTVKAAAVLDRTKEPGSAGEPLYQDVLTAFAESGGPLPKVIGGRYGLSSKEFTPAMVKAIFDELQKQRSKNHFTIGIHDDVTHTSLPFDATFSTEDPATTRAIFYGLGADGTVGANKNSIKIIGEETEDFAQGYFVYDSKKSGSVTISHLRFGPRPIRSAYLISRANFIGCHQFGLLEKLDVLSSAEPNATFLLNSPYDAATVWEHLPHSVQAQIVDKQLKFYVIDAYNIAREAGLGGRMNTILQTCFFALSNILPRDQALMAIKKAIQKTYGSRGPDVVQKNVDAVDRALNHLFEVKIPETVAGNGQTTADFLDQAPDFVRNVTAPMMRGQGDELPVSAMPCDGTFPSGTSKWEKR